MKEFGEKQNAGQDVIDGLIAEYNRQFKEDLKYLSEFGDKLLALLKECLVKIRFFIKKDQPLLSSNKLLPYYDAEELKKWQIEDGERLEREMKEAAVKDEAERKKVSPNNNGGT